MTIVPWTARMLLPAAAPLREGAAPRMLWRPSTAQDTAGTGRARFGSPGMTTRQLTAVQAEARPQERLQVDAVGGTETEAAACRGCRVVLQITQWPPAPVAPISRACRYTCCGSGPSERLRRRVQEVGAGVERDGRPSIG